TREWKLSQVSSTNPMRFPGDVCAQAAAAGIEARNVLLVSIRSSLGNGLGDPEVGEEIAELLVRQAVEQPGGHEALARGLDLLDVRGLEGDVLAVQAAEHRHL